MCIPISKSVQSAKAVAMLSSAVACAICTLAELALRRGVSQRSRAAVVLLVLGSFLLLLTSGCHLGGGMWQAGEQQAPRRVERPPSWNQAAQVVGDVPAVKVGEELVRAELVDDIPVQMLHDPKPLPVPQHAKVGDLVRLVEYTYSMTYDQDDKIFRRAVATSDVDSPDAAGRATAEDRVDFLRRQTMVLRVCFVHGALGATYNAGSLSADHVEFAASVPAGVRRPWINVSTERSSFDTLTDTNSGRTFNTKRTVVPSGVQFDGMVAPLYDGCFRITGNLSVSTFNGNGVDRSIVTDPVEVDGLRGIWLLTTRYRSMSAGLAASLRGIGLKVNGGDDEVAVFVRVD
jgi:hypothetical protein